MSDSAKTTWYTAPSIGRLGTITRAPEESPTNANHAIEANDGNAGDCVQLKPEQDASSVPLSPKCFATTTERAGCLRSVASGMLGYPATDVGIPVDEVKLLAQGGYNDVWLISFRLLQEVSVSSVIWHLLDADRGCQRESQIARSPKDSFFASLIKMLYYLTKSKTRLLG